MQGDRRALQTAARAYALRPSVAGITDTYGWLLVDSGQAGKGLPLLERAAALDRKNPSIAYHLAVAYARVGKKVEALSGLRAISASKREFPERTAADSLQLFEQRIRGGAEVLLVADYSTVNQSETDQADTEQQQR
jgi:predicted Zn-dependent protease